MRVGKGEKGEQIMMDRNGRALKRLADSRTAVFLVTLGAFIFTLSVESPAMNLSFQEKDLGAFPSDWKARTSTRSGPTERGSSFTPSPSATPMP